ncbi:MAG: RNA-guided endonuclease InsQ/TnpB family protein, partial [Ktedonobacteraceae bacterium]
MKQKKAYKYRFSPSDEQKHILAQTFGCCRYVYNWALRQRTDAYYQQGERLYYEGTAQRLVTLKKQEETLWLNEVSSVPLQQALRHLDRAFRNFFEGRADYPTFKKKRHQQAATYTSNTFTWDGHALTLAKMDAPLNIVWHRPLADGCKPSNVTITKDEAERYFVSILVEEDMKPLEVTPKRVGLDLGLKS